MSIVPYALTVVLSAAAAFLLVLAFWPKRFLKEVSQHTQEGMIRGVRSAMLSQLGSLNQGVIGERYRDRVTARIIQAGELGGLRPEEFLAIQEISAVVFLGLGAGLLWLLNLPVYWGILVGIFGFFLPVIWLNDQVAKRHLEISRALPYNLDLLTLAVEAGLDFAAGVGKVCERGKQGALTDDMGLMLNELKLGKTREEALRNMATRAEHPGLTAFATALIQADRMGTPIGAVLRIQSSQLRSERTQRAEKLAAEAPVKMLFPLVLCIFPTVFMVLFGPIVFKLVFGKFS